MPITLYAPPATPVFPAGYPALPGDFDNWVQSSLGFCTQKIVFRGHQTSTTSQASGFSLLPLNHIDEDPYGGWNSGGGNQWWTAPYTGFYQVTVSVVAQATAMWLSAAVVLTGGAPTAGSSVLVTSGNSGGATVSLAVAMIGGEDNVKAYSGSSVNFSTNISAIGQQSSMEITFLSS